ncbi:MAG: hypothetical protein NVS3B20_02780 [Polyangiales bacterium]
MSPVFSSRALWVAPLLTTSLVVLGALVGGCPIYQADTCESDPNCVRSRPIAFADDAAPADPPPDSGSTCGAGCSSGYICQNVASGRYECTPQDCRATEKACAAGRSCTLSATGVYACTSSTPTDCESAGCIAGYTCAPGAPGTRICTSSDPNACVLDGDCSAKTGAGSLCLGGFCKAPKDLCTDSTQCKAGATCIDGRCDVGCSATCATGYTCDSKNSVCVATAPGECDTSKKCTSSATCVAGRCVSKAGITGTCPIGFNSVAGGCVIDDRPVFFCDTDGSKDGKQDKCAVGSVCLHHNCYVGCASATDTATCATVDKYKICKSVTSSSGAHFVCGSNTTFGSECDLTVSPPRSCTAAGRVCIDGFCK